MRYLSILLAALTGCGATPAFCWGVVGHAAVADIAESRLTPQARRQVTALLALENISSLDRISTWADDWGALHKETKPWHYVDIPIGAPGYDKARDCPSGDCVVVKIDDYLGRLKDRGLSPTDRLQALKFVVHFIGDLHQPLHAGENGDFGGNKILVSYFGETVVYGTAKLNLHSLWDTAIIERRSGVRESREAPVDDMMAAGRKMSASLGPKIKEPPGPIDPIAWANEAQKLSREIVYHGILAPGQPSPPGPIELGADYDAAAWPVIEVQLMRAGARLAEALNDALN